MTSYPIKFITPLFSRGSYEDIPEIRPPSIRGQLHWWFRALGGNHATEKAIFGGIGRPTISSKVVIRLSAITGETGNENTLPHKSGGAASPKIAYLAGTTFQLHVLERLGGLDAEQRKWFDRTLHTWLIAGALGLRSTRGGGAFQWEEAPTDPEIYRTTIASHLQGAPLKFALLEPAFESAESARSCATDTISHQALSSISFH